MSDIDPRTIPLGQPWKAVMPSGYLCTAVKRMKPNVDDEREWVIVASDGRSHIGGFPNDMKLVRRIS